MASPEPLDMTQSVERIGRNRQNLRGQAGRHPHSRTEAAGTPGRRGKEAGEHRGGKHAEERSSLTS